MLINGDLKSGENRFRRDVERVVIDPNWKDKDVNFVWVRTE